MFGRRQPGGTGDTLYASQPRRAHGLDRETERSGCCGRQASILLLRVFVCRLLFSRIHPKDKRDVAHRLVLGARSVAYGEVNVTFQGPFPQRITLSPAEVVVNYDQALLVTRTKKTFEVRLVDER